MFAQAKQIWCFFNEWNAVLFLQPLQLSFTRTQLRRSAPTVLAVLQLAADTADKHVSPCLPSSLMPLRTVIYSQNPRVQGIPA